MSEEARKQVSLFTKQASFWYVCFNQTMLGKVHRQGMPKVEQQLFVVCSIWRDLGPSINIAFKKAPVKLAVRGKWDPSTTSALKTSKPEAWKGKSMEIQTQKAITCCESSWFQGIACSPGSSIAKRQCCLEAGWSWPASPHGSRSWALGRWWHTFAFDRMWTLKTHFVL